MEQDRIQEAAFSHLMEECFKINRQLIAAVSQLTKGPALRAPNGACWALSADRMGRSPWLRLLAVSGSPGRVYSASPICWKIKR